MSRVLYLAYHFPPIGGGGVQRNAKFARYLPEFGHTPIVVTGAGGATDRWAPEDASMLGEVNEGATVYRIASPEPQASGRRASLEWRLMLETTFSRWWRANAVELAERVGSDSDVVFASLVPYDVAAAAPHVARRLGKPWIADLQDPWALDEMWPYPTGAHRLFDGRRMRRCLSSAAAIVMNTPEAALRVRRSFPELADRVVSIPNGYDATDFEGAVPTRNDDRFRIVHTGYLYTDQGYRFRRMRPLRRVLGGAQPVDMLTRSHVYLLRALEELSSTNPALTAAVEVVLAGVLTERDRKIAEESHIPVRLTGYVSHAEAVELMRAADLLFLPMHDLPVGMRAGLVPGKTYEYLASERPILAAVPDGDARDLLEEAGSAVLARPTDYREMARLIGVEVERWQAGRPAQAPRPDVLRRYERRELTRQLAEVIDSVSAREPAKLLNDDHLDRSRGVG